MTLFHFTLKKLSLHQRVPSHKSHNKVQVRTERLVLEIGRHYLNENVLAPWQDTNEIRLERKLGEIAIELVVAGEQRYRESVERNHQWRLERKADLED